MMRKLIFVGVLVLAMSGLALAQDFPKFEVFGGYSYLRNDLADATSWIGDYYGSDFGASKGSAHGFEASFTYNLNKWFGIKGDFSTHFGKIKMDGKDKYSYDYPDEYYNGYTETYTQKGGADFRQYTYLFGPEFSYRKFDKFRPFAHLLVGFTKVDVHKVDVQWSEVDTYESGSTYTYDETLKGTFKGTSFALAVGGGIDINVNKKVSLRMPQVDYIYPSLRDLKADLTDVYTNYDGYVRTDSFTIRIPTTVFHNMRISAGVVYKF
jgi:hypothetical protein